MEKQDAAARFAYLAEAFAGTGGFAPRVKWADERVELRDATGGVTHAYRRVPRMVGPCHLIPHPRESPEKFAARAAVTVYENHLREACERFVGYLGRRKPIRDGVDSPLVKLLLDDADMRGTPLDELLVSLALHAKARGSMLLMIDMPQALKTDAPASLRDQIARRAVPFLRQIKPEDLVDYGIDSETGLFRWIEIEDADGHRLVIDSASWERTKNGVAVAQGEHTFGQCPVLAFTESGDVFPHVGKYAQIADISRGIFNNRSRLEEILGSQTFSILALQINETSIHSVADLTATIGTSSMVTHTGIAPSFIAPDQGNAETYMKVIDQLQAGIARIAMDEATAEAGGAESGVARRLRFERLNSDLASFARRLRSLELRMWTLFSRGAGIENRVMTEWPSDFNLVDSATELDILAQMQATGFPAIAQVEKRLSIAGAEFDGLDPDTRAEIAAAIREQAQEQPAPTTGTM